MMNDRLKGVAEYMVREALYGWYNQRDANYGDNDIAVVRAYNVMLLSIREKYSDTTMAKELTKAILMAYWGRALGQMDMSGDRYKRATLQVYKAIRDSVEKTQRLAY